MLVVVAAQRQMSSQAKFKVESSQSCNGRQNLKQQTLQFPAKLGIEMEQTANSL